MLTARADACGRVVLQLPVFRMIKAQPDLRASAGKVSFALATFVSTIRVRDIPILPTGGGETDFQQTSTDAPPARAFARNDFPEHVGTCGRLRMG